MTVRPDNWYAKDKETKSLTLAVQFWHSARLLLENEPRRWVFFSTTSHLLAHSVELALKHYLQNRISKNQLDKTLRADRHNLRVLLERCVEEGLELDMIEAMTILQFQKAHVTHYFRYGKAARMMTGVPHEAVTRVGNFLDRVANARGPLRACYGPNDTDFEFPEPPAIVAKVDKATIKAIAHTLDSVKF